MRRGKNDSPRNEAVFREVNERIEKLTRDGGWLGESESLEVLCECGNRGCSEPLKLSVSDYFLDFRNCVAMRDEKVGRLVS